MANYFFDKRLSSGVGTELSVFFKDCAGGDRFVIKQLTNPEYMDNIKSEIEALTKIHLHENIVSLVDSFVFGDKAFLVYKYYPGGDLYSLVKRKGSLPEKDIVAIVYQLSIALQHARKFGFFHCDVKPENILIKNNDEYILSDWDLSCSSDDVKSSMHYGSTLNMAPEVILGKRHENSDVYSLGCLLHFCIFGERVFGLKVSSLPHVRILKHLEEPYKMKDSHCSESLANLISSMLVKDPSQRISLSDISSYFKGDSFFLDKIIDSSTVYEWTPGVIGYYLADQCKKKSWRRIDKYSKKTNDEYCQSLILAHLIILSYHRDREAQSKLALSYKENPLMDTQANRYDFWQACLNQ